MFGVITMFIAGIICYVIDKHGYPLAPLLLAFVLVPLFEKYMQQGVCNDGRRSLDFLGISDLQGMPDCVCLPSGCSCD